MMLLANAERNSFAVQTFAEARRRSDLTARSTFQTNGFRRRTSARPAKRQFSATSVSCIRTLEEETNELLTLIPRASLQYAQSTPADHNLGTQAFPVAPNAPHKIMETKEKKETRASVAGQIAEANASASLWQDLKSFKWMQHPGQF